MGYSAAFVKVDKAIQAHPVYCKKVQENKLPRSK